MAKSNQARITGILETSPGVTPANPALRMIRQTEDTLAEEVQDEPSGELSGARGVVSMLPGARRVVGAINGELVANTLWEDFLSSLLGAAWAANVLQTGFGVRTCTIEKSYPVGTPGGTNRHQRFKGVGFQSLELRAAARTPAITYSLGVIGGYLVPDTAIESGATYPGPSPAASLALPMLAGDVAFAWGGGLSTIDTATTCHLESTLSLRGNGEVRQCLGVPWATEFELGRLEGDLSCKFLLTNALHALIDEWQVGLEGSVTITYSDRNVTPNHHTYAFALNRVRMRSFSTPTPPSSQDIVADVVFDILQPDGGHAVTVTRATT